jgi:competence protein ComEC
MSLFWVAAAWLLGILAAGHLSLDSLQWGLLAALSVTAWLILRRHPAPSRIFALLIVAFLGGMRLSSSRSAVPPDHISRFNDSGQSLKVTGRITSFPLPYDRHVSFVLQAETLSLPGGESPRAVNGRILAVAPPSQLWTFGDQVALLGLLESPPSGDGSGYGDYLRRQDLLSTMRSSHGERLQSGQGALLLQGIYAARGRGLAAIAALFPDPEAALLKGVLFGVESEIPADVRDAFDRTGTSHIIAISGMNITILAGAMVATASRWLGPRRGSVFAGLAIGVYTIMVGADPAVVRAALMGGLALLARMLGRQTYAYASLGAAAWVMTLLNPQTLWDAGFQLSFAATVGLIIYGPPLEAGFARLLARHLTGKRAQRAARTAGELLLLTFAAQATTLPVSMSLFGRLPVVGLLANPLILPVQPPMMVLGGLAALLGMIWTPLGVPLAWLACPLATHSIRSVEWLAQFPGAALTPLRISPLAPITYFLVLAAVTYLVLAPAAHSLRTRIRDAAQAGRLLPASFALLAGALAVAAIWRSAAGRPDGRLHLHLLDIGSGEAVLIRTPTGRHILINGGPSRLSLADQLGRLLPSGSRDIDWIILAGSGYNQVSGLEGLIDRLPIGAVWIAIPPSGGTVQRLLDAWSDGGIRLVPAAPGQALELGGGAMLTLTALGDRGAVLLLVHGKARILLPFGGQPDLTGVNGPVDILLLGDGGSLSSNPPEMLHMLQPRAALISLAPAEAYGQPAQQVLAILGGVPVLRTDRSGALEVVTDGEHVWINTQRRSPDGLSDPQP